MPGVLLTPRPLPDRRLPIVVGATVVGLALPLFLVAGWRLQGWALGAVLWAASQVLGLVLARVGIHEPTLRGSGLVAFGMMGRGILLGVVVVVLAAADPYLALAGALVYAAGYSAELALSLLAYFSGSTPR
ncbi:MAG TPA: hypothetical protein VHF23_09675 [Gaiellaceae bacterium]|nr:hypothetical protein [Gaiellaceae bacterium]